MHCDMNEFVREILNSSVRRVIPIMTSPGIELIGARPQEVFQDGALQFRCIEALAQEVHADALVTFMDLSVEAEAFGCPIKISEHENPTVSAPIVSDGATVRQLTAPEVGSKRTGATLKCAALCAARIHDRPIFGGMIGPFSLAGRLADMSEMMIMAAAEPETAALLLDKITEFLIEYARAIKNTGVNGLIIAEPAAGLLSPDMCREFAADYIRRIIDAVQDRHFMVILHNCGNTGKQVPELLATGAAALHLGNAVDLTQILPQIPADTLLMGNIDPVGILKSATPATVYAQTSALLQATGAYPNYVLSSGCDIPPGASLPNIRAFFQAAEDYNRKLQDAK